MTEPPASGSGRRPRARRLSDAALTRADLTRLRYALGRRAIDPTVSLYGPQSRTWEINRESVLLLGGGRALLMQIAHPLVAAGVAAHSGFQREPLQRLRRTLDLMQTIAFDDAAGALRAVRRIEHVHTQVRGTLDERVGPFAAGTPYDAADPQLQFWVHATLVDSALVVFERFVRPLAIAERRAYYDESRIGARLFGIAEGLIPPTLAAFRDYMRARLASPELAIGRDGRALAAAILRPPLLPGLRQLAGTSRLFTIGLLPPSLRRRYGFEWSPAREAALNAVAAASRRGLPLLPDVLRHVARSRRAAR